VKCPLKCWLAGAKGSSTKPTSIGHAAATIPVVGNTQLSTDSAEEPGIDEVPEAVFHAVVQPEAWSAGNALGGPQNQAVVP
jgi:hypothetical protein